MLAGFLLQGYGMFSITFSTIFIVISYIFSVVFCLDLLATTLPRILKILVVSGLAFLVLSSVGPFILAYILSHKIHNPILYKDAVYTYLHLQYSGFFTLIVFALLFKRVWPRISASGYANFRRFAWLLIFSVLPSMFISYLWHYPQAWIKIIAACGSIALSLCTVYFIRLIYELGTKRHSFTRLAVSIVTVSMLSFFLKTAFQALTIIPALGKLVFSNRPVIIGFLHLVLLGFVSLYILAHLLQIGFLRNSKAGIVSVWIFSSGVIANEVLLMVQGLGGMIMQTSSIFPVLLWVTAIWLFVGALMMLITKSAGGRVFSVQLQNIFSNPIFYSNKNLKT